MPSPSVCTAIHSDWFAHGRNASLPTEVGKLLPPKDYVDSAMTLALMAKIGDSYLGKLAVAMATV